MPRSPLHDRHESLGARFTHFGAWEMPVQYAGVLAEHEAVRTGAGVFDVSHLGRFRVSGTGAADLLRRELCADVATIAPGRAQYTMALNDRGGVEDDIIVWWLDDEYFWVLPNGANFAEVLDRFASAAPEGTEVAATQDITVLLAVQGPAAPGIVEKVLGSVPRRFRVEIGEYREMPVWAAGTGYTGERGAEIAVPLTHAGDLFDDLIAAGATPCGLGARDTLRLEMGYPLWGQDLDETTTPLEAGLEWVVDWDHDFVGREALEAQRRDGLPRRMVAFRTGGRAIPRHGYPIRSGASTGTVASGNFSPGLGCGIGMGYLAPPSDDGVVEVQIRGEWIPAEVVDPPFIET
jgi:aminomethyltransferase